MKGPIEYIKESWRIYTKKENFIFFSKIMAVLVIGSSLLGYPLSYFRTSNNEILIVIFAILSAIFGLWSQSTQYFAILKMGEPEKEIFKIGYQKIGRFLLILIVMGLIILAGTILLIIPAIIFGVWYSFSIWLVLDKNIGIKESLRISKQMVSGKFWKILGRSLVFGLFSFLVAILLSIIPYAGSILSVFIAPFFMLPFYLLYKDLSVADKDLLVNSN